MPFYVYMALTALNQIIYKTEKNQIKKRKLQEHKWTWHFFLTCFVFLEDVKSF